jgi:hypothetical protein
MIRVSAIIHFLSKTLQDITRYCKILNEIFCNKRQDKTGYCEIAIF